MSITVLPDEVDTVFELLLTVLETVEDVTVSVALDGCGRRIANAAKISNLLFFIDHR